MKQKKLRFMRSVVPLPLVESWQETKQRQENTVQKVAQEISEERKERF